MPFCVVKVRDSALFSALYRTGPPPFWSLSGLQIPRGSRRHAENGTIATHAVQTNQRASRL